VRQKCHMSARPPRPPMASEVRKSSDSESTHGPVRAAVADLSPPRLVGHHATAAAAAAIAGGSWGGDQGIGGGLRFFALFLSPSSRWASRSFSPPVAWCRRHSWRLATVQLYVPGGCVFLFDSGSSSFGLQSTTR
jgi:hypothetical protein